MSPRPWMQGAKEIWKSQAIELVTPEDNRASVPQLLVENEEQIAKIKEALAKNPLYDQNKHDDLWILRFSLSHKKKTRSAIQAAENAIQFRAKHNLDDKNLLCEGPPHETHYNQTRYNGHCILVAPNPKRGTILFLDADQINYDSSKILTDEEWYQGFLYNTEYSFQWCDYVTRTTGRLTKGIRCANLASPNLSYRGDATSRRRDKRVVSDTETVYPQLTQCMFVCHPPFWINSIFVLFKLFLPRRVIEKVQFINPSTDEADLKVLLPFVSKADLPIAYGGENTVPPQQWKLPI